MCFALQYASAALKADKELVKAAIAQDPSALQYASAELQNDREVVHLATPPKAKLSGIDASQAVREARAAALELARARGIERAQAGERDRDRAQLGQQPAHELVHGRAQVQGLGEQG